MNRPVIGVLLPVRLETRFTPPAADAGWLLKLRIVPDAVSLDQHQPLATADELSAVQTLWQFTDGDLTTEQGKSQWRRFAVHVGAARGAWLARTFPAVADPGGGLTIELPPTVREGLSTGRVAGLPKALQVWIARGGARAQLMSELDIDPDGLGLDIPDPESGETRWWSSFKRAKEVGLGAEIDLGPARPDDLDSITVVGLGEEDPRQLFTAHRDAGTLGILRLGTSTNSVDGEPAADLARDPMTWLTLLTAPPSQPSAVGLSTALTGDPGALGPLPGGDLAHRELNQWLVAGVWSALWGHWVKDVWGAGKMTPDLGVWAFENLVPEGPQPPIRIGDQPYGVLPVTSARRWIAESKDPAVEVTIARLASSGRDRLARSVEAAGNVVGADTDRLLELIGQVPNSRGYAWRWALPLDLIYQLSWSLGPGAAHRALEKWWNGTAEAVIDITGRPPARPYGMLGYPQDLALPLVVPTNLGPGHDLGEALKRLLQIPPANLASPGVLKELFQPVPNSLLFRLLLHSRLVDAAEVARFAAGETEPLLEPVTAASSQPTQLSLWGSRFTDAMVTNEPPGMLFELGRKSVSALIDADPVEVERVFRATLDTASHRVDPWLTGLASRRLNSLTEQGAQFALGAYGWVESPRPRSAGEPEPEFLHAPSAEQALTSAVLRDRALTDPEAGRWAIDLTSAGVQLVSWLTAEVRLGAHLSEAAGRFVEGVLGSRTSVNDARRLYPIRTEHVGRRVCDGLAVVKAYTADPAGVRAQLSLDAARQAGVEALAAAVDDYGDLLVSGAVFDVVSGRTQQAAASMEAAAGLGAPPTLDVLRTARSGRTARSTVVVAMPDAPTPAVVDTSISPALLADPAVAAAIVDLTGVPSGPAWSWSVLSEAGAVLADVTLADLALHPVDTLSLSGDELARWAVSAVPGGVSALAPPGPGKAQRLADLFGSRPAMPEDLSFGGSPPSGAAAQADLANRYAAVHALAAQVQASFTAAATTTELARVLIDALRWGITPLRADGPPPAALAGRCAMALAERISAAPLPAEAAVLAPAPLARALAELVSPQGRLPVLARMRLDQVPTALTPEPTVLDPDWLEVVSAVRPHLARLEVHQLSAASPLSVWTSRPGDPWQLDRSLDAQPVEAHGLVTESHLLAVFSPPGTLDPGGGPDRMVAFGLLDAWSEVIPAPDHATTAALHYDAPGARAPQAILIAVPPHVGTPLSAETLVEILDETRALGRARAAGPAERDPVAAGAPMMLLPTGQPTGISLDPR